MASFGGDPYRIPGCQEVMEPQWPWREDAYETVPYQYYCPPQHAASSMQRSLKEETHRMPLNDPWSLSNDVTDFSHAQLMRNAYPYTGPYDMGYQMSYGLPSPPKSEPRSIETTSCYGDRQGSPPNRDWRPVSPEPDHQKQLFTGCGDQWTEASTNGVPHYSCVAMHDVQLYADAQPTPYEEEQTGYGLCPQEGYQTVQSTQDLNEPMIEPNESFTAQFTGSDDIDQKTSDDPIVRRRRRPTTRSGAMASFSGKITKRSLTIKPSPSSSAAQPSRASTIDSKTPLRYFPCPLAPYGCSSTFGSKNEWKRHVTTQHLRLEYWRCDQCPMSPNKRPNNFNRKDLFVQHVRRMHAANLTQLASATKKSGRAAAIKKAVDAEQHLEDMLNDASKRCHQRLREAPMDSRCVFCEHKFGDWDSRMEHVGKHLEEAKRQDDGRATSIDSWHHDEGLEQWLIKERLVMRQNGEWILEELA